MTFLNNRPEVDNSWTLFLDRDGVINVESVGSYITTWDEFKFHDGVLQAIKDLSGVFGNIVVVTNQRGVGKEIMTLSTLKEIHANMKDEVAENGGRINKVYACTALLDTDHNRKPNVGMGHQAQQDFPEIDFKKSIMVGNSMSDMEFGKRLGMHTIFLTTKYKAVELPNDVVDEQFASLNEWAQALMATEMVNG